MTIAEVTGLPGANSDVLEDAVMLPKTGAVGFGSVAQQDNRVPGDGNLLQKGPEQQLMKSAADPFWTYTSNAIDAKRWNKRFPYQLLVLNVKGGVYTRDYLWEFTLPIPPESLTVSTPFAINTQVTLGGIVEEHGGAPIRTINFTGTMGVLPNRESGVSGLAMPTLPSVTGIAAGTIQSITQTAESGSVGLRPVPYNLMDEADLDNGKIGENGRGTGYYQLRLLQQFLEGYVNLKMNGGEEARHKRLAVAMWKDESIYLVTPTNFEYRRSATDPLAYGYSMSFKAYSRVRISKQPSPISNYQSRSQDPSFLQAVLNGIQAARTVLEGAKNTLDAVRGDVDQLLFQPLRSVCLLLKSGLSVNASLADLPESIAKDCLAATAEFNSTKTQVRSTRLLGLGGLSLKELSTQRQDQADFQAASQSQQSQAQTAGPASPARKAFGTAKDHFSLMSGIDVQGLPLKPAILSSIQAEIDRVRLLERHDFEGMRDQILEVAQAFASSIGEGDVTFNTTYSRPIITAVKVATDEDYSVLFALNSAAIEMSRMAVSGPRATSARVQAIDFVAGLATRSGIAFTVPTSKFTVPFIYGATLEQMSARYLGNPNRWHEIVALNGLRSPYVDEEGYDISLLTNGNNNQVVTETSAGLYAGQQVSVYSSTVSPERRRITSIEVISDTMSFVNLDGAPDLSRFTLAQGAKLHAYLPNTVNSQMMMYIPSTQTVEDLLTSKTIPGINDYTQLIEAGGVDLLLTQSGDAAIDDSGDWKFAVGLTNLVQRVRIAFATPKGSLPQHPDFGLGLSAGASTADLDAKQLLEAAKAMFSNDSDFSGVFSASVAKNGPGVRLSVSVGIAGQDSLLPVSVDVVR